MWQQQHAAAFKHSSSNYLQQQLQPELMEWQPLYAAAYNAASLASNGNSSCNTTTCSSGIQHDGGHLQPQNNVQQQQMQQ